MQQSDAARPRHPESKVVAELVDFVAREMKARHCDASVPSVARCQVFEEAMDVFLEKCPSYAPFLERYRSEQMRLRDWYAVKVRKLPELSLKLETAKVRGEAETATSAQAAREIESSLKNENENLRKELKEKTEILKNTEEQVLNLAKEKRLALSECEELRRSSIVVTEGTRRLEEERQKWQQMDNSNRGEILTLTSSLQKVNGEKDVLTRQLQDLEISASKEVTEKTASLKAEVTTLKKDLDQLRSSNRALQRQFRTQKEEADTREKELRAALQTASAKGKRSSRASRSSFGSLSDAPTGSRLNTFDDNGPPPSKEKGPTTDEDDVFKVLGVDPDRLAREEEDEDDDNTDKRKVPNFFGPYDWYQEEAWTGDLKDLEVEGFPGIADYAQKYQEKLKEMLYGKGNVVHEQFPLLPNVNPLTEDWEPAGQYFQGRGTGDDVPPYLRFQGRVRNWLVSKRDTENFVNDIWAAREEDDKTREEEESSSSNKTSRPTLPEFLYTYLVTRFKSHVLAVEYAYNLLDALERYKADSDCRLFIEILEGRLPEAIIGDQLAMLVNVYETMEKDDRVTGSAGYLTTSRFMVSLRKLFKAKPEANFQRLQRALFAESKPAKSDAGNATNSRVVYYKELLESDEDGNQGPFCELLREQHVEEIMDFTTELVDAVRDAAVARKATATSPDETDMPIAKYREVIQAVDPDKPRNDISTILATGIGTDLKGLIELELKHATIDYETFLANVAKTMVLKRSTTPPPEEPVTISSLGHNTEEYHFHQPFTS